MKIPHTNFSEFCKFAKKNYKHNGSFIGLFANKEKKCFYFTDGSILGVFPSTFIELFQQGFYEVVKTTKRETLLDFVCENNLFPVDKVVCLFGSNAIERIENQKRTHSITQKILQPTRDRVISNIQHYISRTIDRPLNYKYLAGLPHDTYTISCENSETSVKFESLLYGTFYIQPLNEFSFEEETNK